jgi:two-component system sensor histidine kinase YesM
MNQVVKGKYECDVVEECEDEIGQLTKNCDNTVKHLVKLMEENYQKSIHQRELELQRLQAQINPHFLFNTLNSFKYIAMLNNMPVLEEGITSFCNLLRQTIVLEDELIPIEQEFDNIKNYCKVQSIRYAGRFELVCSIDNKVKDKKIPRMILQPLVENCLIHGMKEDVLLNIELNAYEEDTKIIILIQDDGKGMDINHDVISKNKSICFNRIGLENVKERLEIIYSGKSVLKIYSEKGKGTEIRLEIEGYYV